MPDASSQKNLEDLLKIEFPQFDISMFKHLQEDTSEEVSYKILARYKSNLNDMFLQLSTAITEGNLEIICKLCHKIAGNSELLGFSHFGRQSRHLSQYAQTASDLNEIESDLNKYLQELNMINMAIEKAFPNYTKYL